MAGLGEGFAVIYRAALYPRVSDRDRLYGGTHRVRQIEGAGANFLEVAPHDLEELLVRTCEIYLQAR